MRPIALLFLSLAASACCAPPSKGSSGSGAPAVATPAVATPAVPVTAADLIAAYKGNEVRGDSQWKDKRVRVTGKVGDIKKDFTGGTYVVIGTGAQFEIPAIQCSLASDDDKAVALNKGDTVIAEGTVSGLMMNVQVKGCRIQ